MRPDHMILPSESCKHDEGDLCDSCRVWTQFGWISYKSFERALDRQTERAMRRLRKAGLIK